MDFNLHAFSFFIFFLYFLFPILTLHWLFKNTFNAVSVKEAEKVNDGENVSEDGHGVLGGGEEAELCEEVFYIFLLYSFLTNKQELLIFVFFFFFFSIYLLYLNKIGAVHGIEIEFLISSFFRVSSFYF